LIFFADDKNIEDAIINKRRFIEENKT